MAAPDPDHDQKPDALEGAGPRTQRRPHLDWAEAEAQRKAGRYSIAGRAFHEMWKESGQAAAGWRYAYCLRKAGYPAAALKLAVRVVDSHPSDEAARNEVVWCLYFARMKAAQAADDAQAILQAAGEMVRAGAQGLALELAVFAALGAAKEKGHWDEVDRWCDLLDPAVLSDEPQKGPGGRRIPSTRERYYFARLKSLVELERWPDAMEMARDACEQYPRNLDFLRWQAEAHAGLGNLEEAIRLLEPLRRDHRARWYHLADLARFLLELGRLDPAWEAAQASLRMPAEDQARVGLLATMAQIALDRQDPETAARHLAWCLALRREQEWPVPRPLAELRRQLEETGVDWDAPARVLKGACLPGNPKADRPGREGPLRAGRGPGEDGRRTPGPRPGAGEPGGHGLPPLPGLSEDGTLAGVVTSYRDDRPYAFVRVGNGENLFVLVDELPEDSRHDGARVCFLPIRNFDRKKQREAWRASQVRAAD